jgi:hypothetical protein
VVRPPDPDKPTCKNENFFPIPTSRYHLQSNRFQQSRGIPAGLNGI